MNERIKELAHQADFINKRHNGDDWRWGWIDPELAEKLEKFAELIVRECMTTVLKESKLYWDKDEFESANAIQNAARRVKEHFGVE
jgi:hypothetical protein